MKKALLITLALLGMALRLAAQDPPSQELTNLVIFVRFSDDAEIDHNFDSIDSLFNSRKKDYYSVYNYYDAMTYGRIHYNTVYTNNVQNGQIVSYVDSYPRGTFQPYSTANPIGYHGDLPFIGISMLEAQLLERIFAYVDTMHLVPDSVNLDGDDDGDIDNISIIVKGDVGDWATLLWPHMEYFPHDSIDHPVTINGVKPNTFNFEFEGADYYFSAATFCHEMGHSLGLPDLYHYIHYPEVLPAGWWDIMCTNPTDPTHTAAIYKNKILHVADDPIEITADGDYTLLSVGSSPSRNCYFIRSAIDSNQFFTFEYRRKSDPFERGIIGTGLLAARWVDTVPLDYSGLFANAFFDGEERVHQYWLFRPESNSDTENGNFFRAHFSQATGRTTFGPTTDPYPYLTDGTPEVSFEITDIHEQGDSLTFHVHFFDTQSIEPIAINDKSLQVFTIDGDIHVRGSIAGQQVCLYDIMGRQLLASKSHDSEVKLSTAGLQAGVYVLKVGVHPAQKVIVW